METSFTGFNSFYPSYADSEEKCHAPVHLSHHYSFSGPSFTVPFITELGTEQLCLLPSALLFSQFHSAGEQTSPWVSWWEGTEPAEVAGTREGGQPSEQLPWDKTRSYR